MCKIEKMEKIEIEEDDNEEFIEKLERINEFRKGMNYYPEYVKTATEMFDIIHSLVEMSSGQPEISKAVGKLIKLSIDNENAIISYALDTSQQPTT